MKIIIKYIPNIITITRIIMSFLFINTIVDQFVYGQDLRAELIILFLAICCSDLLDGRVARKIKTVSCLRI